MRKTVKVAELVDTVNAMLANSTDDQAQGREALAVLIERALFDADAYKGFRYLTPDGDETRRAYIIADGLR
jgi:hypothetical protein